MQTDPFQFWKENASLEFQENDTRIYSMDDEEYLFIGQTMYASTTEQSWYIQNVHGLARGKCLEIGLGLGVASKVILANKEVSHLLTVETNPNVIKAFGRPLRKHNILEGDVYKWLGNFLISEPMYDLIFVDHYASVDEEFETLQELSVNLKKLLKPKGNIVFWIDENSEEEDQKMIRDLWV